MAFTILYSITILVAFIGNALLIFIVTRKPDTRTLTGFLFVNMAVADLLVILIIMPLNTTFLYTYGLKWLQGTLGHVTCPLMYFIFLATTAASILSLLFMSVDRYLGVVFPLHRFPRFRRVKVLTVVIWLSSMIFSIPAAIIWRFEKIEFLDVYICAPNFSRIGKFGMKGFYMYLFLLMYLIPLLMMSSLYVLIGRALWLRNAPGRQLSNQGKQRNEITKRKVMRTLVIITVVFALCWLPTHYYYLIFAFRPDSHDRSPLYVLSLCFWSGYANSAINPWLYMMLSDNFRKALCDVVCRSKYSPRSMPNGVQSTTRYNSIAENNSARSYQGSRKQRKGLFSPEQWELCRETVL